MIKKLSKWRKQFSSDMHEIKAELKNLRGDFAVIMERQLDAQYGLGDLQELSRKRKGPFDRQLGPKKCAKILYGRRSKNKRR